MILVLKIVEHDIFFLSKNTRLFLYKREMLMTNSLTHSFQHTLYYWSTSPFISNILPSNWLLRFRENSYFPFFFFHNANIFYWLEHHPDLESRKCLSISSTSCFFHSFFLGASLLDLIPFVILLVIDFKKKTQYSIYGFVTESVDKLFCIVKYYGW
jgi:hypothetical protein